MATYRIVSVKHSETLTASLRVAIERALAIDEEYQPAFGVTLALATRDSTLLETDHLDEDIARLSDEAGEAGDLDQVALCARALEGDTEARVQCLLVIASAAAHGAY